MPQTDNQFSNSEIIGHILRSAIGVIGRRTSETYATMAIRSIVVNLSSKYDFFRYVEIKSPHLTERSDVVMIKDNINNVNSENIGNASTDFVKSVIDAMGKNAGYYFIKEIKEDLPTEYELAIKNLGVNLDFLQMEYITNRKDGHKYEIKNSEILKHVFTTLFEIIERESGRRASVSIMRELITRYSTEYTLLKFVKVNDSSSIQNIDSVTVETEVNSIESDRVGTVVQKIIQEVNKSLGDKGGSNFVEKLKNLLNVDHIYRLEKIGVDINIISLGQALVVRNVLKSLIDVFSEASTQSYAVLMVNNVLQQIDDKYSFLKQVKIDSMHYAEGIEAISIPENIDGVRPSDLGRGLQKVVEKFIDSLGDESGHHFIEKFKKHLGKAYILRIEEIGVNLHMIELKHNLAW